MRVAITGAAGQLGTDLAAHCAAVGDDVVAWTRATLDVTDADAIRAAIASAKPDIVFNCAAWTAVDDCESDPARGNLINGTAVGHLALATAAAGAHLVQVSTDYVFDGENPEPYTEADAPNPQSAYGTSKLIGETHALDTDATIVRTSWVCSAHGGNMVATILRLAESHPILRFVSDQRGNPTFTTDLSVALRVLAQDRVRGLVHVTNSGSVSWFEFARSVFASAGLDPARVEPITTGELVPARPAHRPANSVLSNDHFHALGHAPLRPFEAALREIVSSYT